MKKFTAEEIRDLLNQVYHEEISFSRMVEILNEMVSESDETQFKDGDFVVNVCGGIIIFKNNVGDSIYDHAYLSESAGGVIFSNTPSIISIKRHATEEEKQRMLNAIAKEGKRWNEEKKCVEDFPVRKFKVGDKVRIKHGISSETVHGQDPVFQPSMDDFIGTTMTVNRYDDMYGYVICNESDWRLNEDWLEPYVEELKEGDLAIFWDGAKWYALVGKYNGLLVNDSSYHHRDHRGNVWVNAIKFESVEQYEKLIKGEI